jgi:hypothetical protein
MVSESDYDGEGSSLYLDPEKARRARATGEYVWRFVLYVTTAYLALLLRLRLHHSQRRSGVQADTGGAQQGRRTEEDH